MNHRFSNSLVEHHLEYVQRDSSQISRSRILFLGDINTSSHFLTHPFTYSWQKSSLESVSQNQKFFKNYTIFQIYNLQTTSSFTPFLMRRKSHCNVRKLDLYGLKISVKSVDGDVRNPHSSNSTDTKKDSTLPIYQKLNRLKTAIYVLSIIHDMIYP